MRLQSLNDVLVHELQDLHSAEQQLIDVEVAVADRISATATFFRGGGIAAGHGTRHKGRRGGAQASPGKRR